MVLALFLIALTYIFKQVYTIYTSPRLVIVPHQNAVNDLRLSVITDAKRGNPFMKTVVIIGPNHFSANKKEISYTNRNWNLPDKVVMYDRSSTLSKKIREIYPNNEKLKYDHAIFNLLDPINKNFPKARVLPILIGEKVEYEDLSTLVDVLYSNCGYECLIVFSVDFSHYLPYPVADIHDLYSIETLSNKKYEDAKKLEVDSPQSLYIAMKLADKWNLDFRLIANTNSAKLMNNPVAESTSHVLGYYSRFAKHNVDKRQTFIYAYKIGEPLLKLGDRLFYGTENVTLNFDDHKVINNVDIIPVDKNELEVRCEGKHTQVFLPENVLITGYTQGEKTRMVFSPDVLDKNALNSCITYDESTHSFVLN